jgi:hypothetical protein
VADGASGLLKCKDWEETRAESHQKQYTWNLPNFITKFDSMVSGIESNKLSICSSETSRFYRTARHYNVEDSLIPSRTSSRVNLLKNDVSGTIFSSIIKHWHERTTHLVCRLSKTQVGSCLNVLGYMSFPDTIPQLHAEPFRDLNCPTMYFSQQSFGCPYTSCNPPVEKASLRASDSEYLILKCDPKSLAGNFYKGSVNPLGSSVRSWDVGVTILQLVLPFREHKWIHRS